MNTIDPAWPYVPRAEHLQELMDRHLCDGLRPVEARRQALEAQALEDAIRRGPVEPVPAPTMGRQAGLFGAQQGGEP